MAENCEKCKFRAKYDQKPNSFLGRFFAEQSDQRSSAGGGTLISAQAGKRISPT